MRPHTSIAKIALTNWEACLLRVEAQSPAGAGVSPYAELSLSYAGLYRHWLRNGSTGIADGPTIEFHLNHPGDTDAASLLTRICIPIE